MAATRERSASSSRGVSLPNQSAGDGVAAVDDGHGERGHRRPVGCDAEQRSHRHLALLDERDRAPGCARGLVDRCQRRAQDLVGLLAAVDDRLHLLGQGHGLPSKASTASRQYVGHGRRLTRGAVDQHHHLPCAREQVAGLAVVHGELVAPRRPADLRGAHEDLDLVVEAGRGLVLALRLAHHELEPLRERMQELQVALVLDARAVAVGEVAAVVDDRLGVGLVEADAQPRGEPEGRPRSRRPCAHERISASTSSRRRSISVAENASRLSRSSGSVLEGRTLKCQSSKSTETPSRCVIRPPSPPGP